MPFELSGAYGDMRPYFVGLQPDSDAAIATGETDKKSTQRQNVILKHFDQPKGSGMHSDRDGTMTTVSVVPPMIGRNHIVV